MKIEVTDVRNEQDDAFVASQLRAYNATFAVRDFKLLRVFARDTNGSIIGGLLASHSSTSAIEKVQRLEWVGLCLLHESRARG